MARRGLTVIELLVVLAVIGVLIAITVPAVHAARNASLQMSCAANLHQLGLAVAGYESTWGCYPPGYYFRYRLLPYLEQVAVFEAGPQNGPFGSPTGPDLMWIAIADKAPAVFRCPADGSPHLLPSGTPSLPFTESAVNYVACKGHHWGTDRFENGIFYYPKYSTGKQVITAADVTNGLSNTAMISEVLHSLDGGQTPRLRTVWQTPDGYNPADPVQVEAFMAVCESIPADPDQFGWIGHDWGLGVPWYGYVEGSSAYYHTLPPNRPSCLNAGHVPSGIYTATSLHRGGVQLLSADGHVSFISENIDRVVWRNKGSRHAPTL